MLNYKGIFSAKNSLPPFYEGGAHFKYIDLYEKLSKLQKINSPNEAMNQSSIENTMFDLQKKNYKNNNILNNINYKEDLLNKLITNKKNNNLCVIKKTIFKNDFIFNKTKSIINYKKIIYNNANKNNIINSKSIQNINKNEKKVEKNNNYHSNEKNNNEKKIIKFKIKKLKNGRNYKNNIFKIKNFKKINYSLPKIGNINFNKNISENNLDHKNSLSDLKDSAYIINNKYNINNICLNSNNLKENKELLINNSNKNNIYSYKHFFSLSNDENISYLKLKNNDLPVLPKLNKIKKTINHNVKLLNNYNNHNNSDLDESSI